MQNVNPEIILYIQENIFPRYRGVDAAHDLTHIEQVIENALEIAADHDVDHNMVYTIAAYHDVGISQGRKTHHLTSAAILREDGALRAWFSPEEIEIMVEAVEDHRASSEAPPRSLYGCIIAEADRDLRPETILQRTWLYGLRHEPTFTREQQFDRLYGHLQEKYMEGGYLKLWLHTRKNMEGLARLRDMASDRDSLKTYVLSQADSWETALHG